MHVYVCKNKKIFTIFCAGDDTDPGTAVPLPPRHVQQQASRCQDRVRKLIHSGLDPPSLQHHITQLSPQLYEHNHHSSNITALILD